ncbi:MAG: VWA domain-containing protein [Acidimicrobiia bacterium]|nr:VWA domain-containing protein [Acidimicrobiia bacterium]
MLEERGWLDDGPRAWTTGSDGADGEGAGAAADGMTGMAPEAEAMARTATDAVEPAPGEELPTEPPASTALRAGSVDDNERWEDYLLYRQDFAALGIPVHDVDVSGRQVLTVVTPDGRPVLGALVQVLDADGEQVAEVRTHADGRALFLASPGTVGDQQQPSRLRVVVEKGDARTEAELDPESREHTVTLDAASTAEPTRLDVLFLIDATGSMGDEIEQLKANMVAVAERIDALPARPDVRFGMTVYRDRGDVFVTRTFDFTGDVATFTTALREVVADGGGDAPESLNQGLHDAIHEPSWRIDDTVSLVFLVADAPPHLDYEDDADYAAEVFEAAERGIKVHPIASSGLDDQGEYVFRQIAQLTMGRFNFLTYGAGGAPEPGDATTHHVDDYSVLSLDELVVRLVTDELAALSG